MCQSFRTEVVTVLGGKAIMLTCETDNQFVVFGSQSSPDSRLRLMCVGVKSVRFFVVTLTEPQVLGDRGLIGAARGNDRVKIRISIALHTAVNHQEVL